MYFVITGYTGHAVVQADTVKDAFILAADNTTIEPYSLDRTPYDNEQAAYDSIKDPQNVQFV